MLKLRCKECEQELLVDVALDASVNMLRIGAARMRMQPRMFDVAEVLIDRFPLGATRDHLLSEIGVAADTETDMKALSVHMHRMRRLLYAACAPAAVKSMGHDDYRLILEQAAVIEGCKHTQIAEHHGVRISPDGIVSYAGKTVQMYGIHLQMFRHLLDVWPERIHHTDLRPYLAHVGPQVMDAGIYVHLARLKNKLAYTKMGVRVIGPWHGYVTLKFCDKEDAAA